MFILVSNCLSLLLQNHLVFYPSFYSQNYTNVFGYFLIIIFLFQIMSGVLLSCFYLPYSLFHLSFDSIYYILIEVFYGFLFRLIHSLLSSFFMFFLYLHFLRGFYLLSFIYLLSFSVRSSLLLSCSINFIYFSGIVLFFLSIINSTVGYIIPFSSLSYWASAVLLNLLSSLFFIFNYLIFDFLWSSSLLFITKLFILHFFLGLLIGILIFIHLLLLHSFSSSIIGCNSLSSFSIPFFPLLFKDSFLLFYLNFLLSYLLLLKPEIFNNVENHIFANPLVSPLFILPEWYFMNFYSLLRSNPSKMFGVFIPILSFILLFALLWSRSLRFISGAFITTISLLLFATRLFIINLLIIIYYLFYLIDNYS